MVSLYALVRVPLVDTLDTVVDRKERVTHNRVVKFYKVLWSNHGEEDATWETEDYLKEVYKTFFKNQ